MLTVTDYQQRTNEEGKDYFVLELTSEEPEMVLSQNTNRYYITVRKCYMSTTFNETICKKMLGREFPGSIIKATCEPYEYTIPETGEVITRNHRYGYSPIAAVTAEQAVFAESHSTEMEAVPSF